jgi:hypothetical protein
MNLAMLAPIAWRTPLRHYGPWDQVTGLLTEGLVSRGIDVTLFATLDSVTSAVLNGICAHGYADDRCLPDGSPRHTAHDLTGEIQTRGRVGMRQSSTRPRGRAGHRGRGRAHRDR